MYSILALQVAAVGIALLLSGGQAPIEKGLEERSHAIHSSVPLEPSRMRCRLYFGCTPASTGSSRITGD